MTPLLLRSSSSRENGASATNALAVGLASLVWTRRNVTSRNNADESRIDGDIPRRSLVCLFLRIPLPDQTRVGQHNVRSRRTAALSQESDRTNNVLLVAVSRLCYGLASDNLGALSHTGRAQDRSKSLMYWDYRRCVFSPVPFLALPAYLPRLYHNINICLRLVSSLFVLSCFYHSAATINPPNPPHQLSHNLQLTHPYSRPCMSRLSCVPCHAFPRLISYPLLCLLRTQHSHH